MYRHILIPTDGSEVAQKGVQAGVELAKALGAKVTFVIASEPLPVFTDPGVLASPAFDMAAYSGAQDENARRALDGAKAAAAGAGVAADGVHVPRSQPAEAILDTAKAQGCDLIAMASHGRRGVGRLLLGSQASEVVTRSAIPVLVLK
ncbi:universal stress protein [Phenylobacterium sp. SCN 70-31]|uniref:universal stress protein n=1 Tax=Phenylobacterium sp. SCN 70-31 TaxID=1660129 RepID=UPI000868F6B2|nr:universal stress protein [Phenylobacterium sp. SCN 70-31]ODT86600.1 MAG: universal stress protein UspA [Phenylobacterium sp. SCN 70-31]